MLVTCYWVQVYGIGPANERTEKGKAEAEAEAEAEAKKKERGKRFIEIGKVDS
jgi:hypothetical protein